MRLSKKNQGQSLLHQSVFASMLLAGVIVSPSLVRAAVSNQAGIEIMTVAQMRQNSRKARGKANFKFETMCGVNGMESLDFDFDHYSDAKLLYPPEMAKCIIFGNQDRARYVCMCADLEDALTGTISGGLIPQIDNFEEEGDDDEDDAYEAFSRFCRAQFNQACGPFPEIVDEYCESERGDCEFRASGTTRDGQYNEVRAGCYCEQGRNWSISQELNEEFTLGGKSGEEMCQAQLAACEPGNEDVFFDFQNRGLDAYSSSKARCARYEDRGSRYDRCRVETSEDGTQLIYDCFCSGTETEGNEELVVSGVADAMWATCERQLDRCKTFPSQIDDEDEEELPEEEKTDDEEEPSVDIGDIFDALGCRAASNSGFGAFLGLGVVILLGGRFRRRGRSA